MRVPAGRRRETRGAGGSNESGATDEIDSGGQQKQSGNPLQGDGMLWKADPAKVIGDN